MKNYNFYDTCSLLLRANNLFKDPEEKIIISSITLNELENIKNSSSKNEDIKYSARKILYTLLKNIGKYEVHIFTDNMLKPIVEKGLSITNDTKILATAIHYDKYCHPDETIFITNDLALRHIANLFFGEDSILSIEEYEEDQYSGYKEIIMSEEEMASFYTN